MRFLAAERAELQRLLPGLDEALAGHPLVELERPGGPGIRAFRQAAGAGLLVPAEHGGAGASARQALRCARAIGSRAPSLSVAATMHHFSVASLVALARHSENSEWMLLDAVARDRLLIASAFAEGRPGQGILTPTMRGEPDGRGWLVTGSKKPCSLSRSADIITASVALPADGGGTELGVALIPARSPRIVVRPFWGSGVLTGAESDELVLERVAVDERLVVRPRTDPGSESDDLNTVGLIWFTLLISGAYLGIASGLVERMLRAGRADPSRRAYLVGELEAAMLALDAVAGGVDAGRTAHGALADALVSRYAAQDAIGRVVTQTVELLGGIAYVTAPDVAYLAAACQALALHPPSRESTGPALDAYLAGEALVLR